MVTFFSSHNIFQQEAIPYVEQDDLILLNKKSSAATVLDQTSSHITEVGEEITLNSSYTKLPAIKLEEEPNPFEQSFEGATSIIPLLLETIRPIAPYRTMLSSTEYNLSASLINTINTSEAFNDKTLGQPTSSDDSYGLYSSPNTKEKKAGKMIRKGNKPVTEEDEIKRRNFLERNRIAALKCRQRKKQWLNDFQTKVECLAAENKRYNKEMNELREELIRLKTMLIEHKDCSINQQASLNALNRPIPGLSSFDQPCEYNDCSITSKENNNNNLN